MRALPPFESLTDELRPVMVKFFDIMYPTGMVLGGIALAASIYRSFHNGWYLTAMMHSGMYLLAAMILIFRRHLPVFFMFSVMIGLISLDVLHSLFTAGLSSSYDGSYRTMYFCGRFSGNQSRNDRSGDRCCGCFGHRYNPFHGGYRYMVGRFRSWR